MVYRVSWLAGLAGIMLALARLQRLLLETPQGPPWQVVVAVAVAAGLAVTWASIQAGFRWPVTLSLNLLAYVAAATYYVAPGTARAGVVPSGETLTILREQFDQAINILRYGSPPVLPLEGLVALTALAFWGLGGLLATGLLKRRPYVALVPPIVFYLQLATLDRRPPGAGWMLALLAVTGLGLAAVTTDSLYSGTPRLLRRRSALAAWAVPVLVIALVSTAAVGTTRVVDDAIPAGGLIDWRSQGGLGDGFFGSLSYNPFVNIQRQLVASTDTPAFRVRLSGDVDPSEMYWKLITLDVFNGSWWGSSNPRLTFLDEGPWEDPSQVFEGPTTSVAQDITILNLQMEWLPAAYAPVDIPRAGRSAERLLQSTKATADGALHLDAPTFQGMRYEIVSNVPRPDLSVLSLADDGLPSILFTEAEGGSVPATPPAIEIPAERIPDDVARFLALPPDIAPSVRSLATRLTAGLETNFEKGLAIETYFRTDPSFRYSTAVPPAAAGSGLADWLTNPSSPGYRLGYCEQFAASMGVLARMAGVPARVVLGFTPGELQPDGSLLVRDRNAHAWVELWMPTQGWVRFDPTPRSDGVNPSTASELPFDPAPYLARIETEALVERDLEGVTGPLGGQFLEGDEPVDPAGGTASTPSGTAGAIVRVLAIVLLVGLAVATIPAAKALRRRRRLHRLEHGDISAAWAEIVDRLTDSNLEPDPSLTPAEVAARVAEPMRPLAAVYSERLYGPERPPSTAQTDVARLALLATEEQLRLRQGRSQRLRTIYGIRSLLPVRLRVKRRRADRP